MTQRPALPAGELGREAFLCGSEKAQGRARGNKAHWKVCQKDMVITAPARCCSLSLLPCGGEKIRSTSEISRPVHWPSTRVYPQC